MEKNDNANGKINIFMYPSVWLQVPSNIKIASVYIQYYTDVCVCVHGGWHCRRKAGASKWTKSGP